MVNKINVLMHEHDDSKNEVMSCVINLNRLQAVLMSTQLSWSSQTDLTFHAREEIGGFSEQKFPLTNFLLFLWQGKSFQKQSGNTKIYPWNAKVRVAVNSLKWTAAQLNIYEMEVKNERDLIA